MIKNAFTALIIGIFMMMASTELAASSSKLKARRVKLDALKTGLSGWSYWSGCKDIQNQIKTFNKKACSKNRFAVSYVGAADVKVTKGKLWHKGGFKLVVYGKNETADMHKAQREALVLTVIIGMFESGEFSGRTKEEYEYAADQIADYIIKDKNSDGAQIDIEPIDETWLPFIKRLSERLNKAGKLSTCYLCHGWTSKGYKMPDKAVKQLFELTDQVALDLYSILVTKPKNKRMSVKKYEKWLRGKLDLLIPIASEAKGRATLGVPASARKSKDYSDADALAYSKAAFGVMKNYAGKPGYNGIAMWLFASKGSKDWQPITDKVWKETHTYLKNNDQKNAK